MMLLVYAIMAAGTWCWLKFYVATADADVETEFVRKHGDTIACTLFALLWPVLFLWLAATVARGERR